MPDEGTTFSPLQGLWAGVTAFVAGGAVAGTSHFVGTAKALEEEGITRAQRMRALPTAGKALALSSAMCCLFGAAGYWGLVHSGLHAKPTAEVSSLHSAITLAEDQRAMIRHEFQKRLNMTDS
jgi:hypothetical protein